MSNNQTDNFIVPTKIYDGVFMSDYATAEDIDWLEMNQVTHIINCAGKNFLSNHKIDKIKYLIFDWNESTVENILDQSTIVSCVGFMEQAKKELGTVLIHYYQSQSRPFCLLAAYFMIKYQWNLFKTLQFLNSRKEDIELQPSFFQQLTSLHQKLHDKGLIKSKNWNAQPQNQDEVILTNTFLNSRKKNQPQQIITKHKQYPHAISWKHNIVTHHQYSPISIISPTAEKKTTVRNMSKQSKDSKEKQRADSLKKQQVKTLIKNNDKSNNITEMNVTKKWNQLRESWIKEKENFQSNTQPSAKNDVQRISDRLQDKLSLLKTHDSKIQSRVNKDAKDNDEIEKVKAENNTIMLNNWIINSQVVRDNGQKKNNKNSTNNKSVIVVKPNHLGGQEHNRTSLKKHIASQKKKNQKDDGVGGNTSAKFFKQQIGKQNGFQSKVRSNSAKPHRKQTSMTPIMKNSSFTSKGKWKF